jgi:hypothetical protein
MALSAFITPQPPDPEPDPPGPEPEDPFPPDPRPAGRCQYVADQLG